MIHLKKYTFGLFVFLFTCNANAQSQKIRLALDWKPEPEFGGFYAAQINDEYKKRSLNVEILPGGAGTPVIQMIAAGKIEFGTASASEVVLARANGADVVALFAVYQKNPQGIMVRASQNIPDLASLFSSGYTIALQKGMPFTAYLEKKFGFSKSKIVPYTGGISLFLKDPKFAQQCFITSEPISAKKSQVEAKTFLFADVGYNPYLTVLVTNRKYLQKNPQTIKDMVVSVREGWKNYLKDPKPTNELMQKLNSSLDLETFNEAALTQISFIETADTKSRGLGVMRAERWKTLSDQLKDLGLIEKTVEATDCFVSY